MKTVNYNGIEYHVNGLQGAVKKAYDEAAGGFKHHTLFQHDGPVFIYNHKNFQGNPDYLEYAVDILKNVKQPSESQVRNAMIYAIGYPGEKPDYMLKAGGESQSDHMYSSSLSVMIAHPKTGLDTDVLILKKYSKKFEDILITEEEVRALFKLCQTPAETELIRKDNIVGLMSLLWRSFQGFQINIGKNEKIATKDEQNLMREHLFKIATNQEINAHIDFWIQRRTEELNIKLVEFVGGETERHRKETQETINKLHLFKVSLLPNLKVT